MREMSSLESEHRGSNPLAHPSATTCDDTGFPSEQSGESRFSHNAVTAQANAQPPIAPAQEAMPHAQAGPIAPPAQPSQAAPQGPPEEPEPEPAPGETDPSEQHEAEQRMACPQCGHPVEAHGAMGCTVVAWREAGRDHPCGCTAVVASPQDAAQRETTARVPGVGDVVEVRAWGAWHRAQVRHAEPPRFWVQGPDGHWDGLCIDTTHGIPSAERWRWPSTQAVRVGAAALSERAQWGAGKEPPCNCEQALRAEHERDVEKIRREVAETSARDLRNDVKRLRAELERMRQPLSRRPQPPMNLYLGAWMVTIGKPSPIDKRSDVEASANGIAIASRKLWHEIPAWIAEATGHVVPADMLTGLIEEEAHVNWEGDPQVAAEGALAALFARAEEMHSIARDGARAALLHETEARLVDVTEVLGRFDERWSRLVALQTMWVAQDVLAPAKVLVDDVLCGVFAAMGGHR